MIKLSTNLAIIVIGLIIVWWVLLGGSPPDERFELPGLPLRSRVHVKLNKNGNTIYESLKPPSAHGELGCTQVPCPSKYADDVTCWCCCNYH